MEIERRKVEAPIETEKWKINSQHEGRESKKGDDKREGKRGKMINMKKEKEESSYNEKLRIEKKRKKGKSM